MAVKLSLSSNEIVNKVFSGTPRGYNPLEVDEYLDRILSDYRLIETSLLLSKKEVDEKERFEKELVEKVKELEIENSKLKKFVSGIKSSDNVTTDNINLLRKIDALEKFLWAHGYNPNTIK